MNLDSIATLIHCFTAITVIFFMNLTNKRCEASQGEMEPFTSVFMYSPANENTMQTPNLPTAVDEYSRNSDYL